MATTAAIQRIVEIDGSELSADIDGQLESVLVVDRLAMPDMFTLVFRDPSRDVVGRASIQIGSKVTISTTSVSADEPEALIKGEVTSIETEYDTLGTRAVVRGYDRSHRLAAGRKTATFQNVKYSDVAATIASAAGLQADVDDSGGTVEHLLQANQSDLDFLYSLARRIGFDCRVDDETLLFKRPAESSGAPSEGDFSSDDPVQLVWEHNLLEFRGRMSAVGQVKQVKVRGWDPSAKEAVIGQADVTATNAEVSMKPADLAAKVGGDAAMVVVDHPGATQESLDELARARAQQVGSAAVEATAVAVGSPALKAGTAVSISGVDPALEGKYVATAARQEFGNGTYRTHLDFSGRQDRSIHGLVSQGSTGGRERFYGVAIGIVTDNQDPQKMGRVKVSYPWLADDAESYWGRLVAPGAGKNSGVVWIPQAGDEVLVAFEHGDISYPLVLGGLWNGQDTVPFDYDSDLDAGQVTFCGLVSRSGHRLSFLESSNESKIQLLTEGGAVSVVFDETNKTVKIECTDKVIIDAQGDVEIKAGGSLKLSAQSSIEIEASGQTKIKGATVALN
jgi:phage protein D